MARSDGILTLDEVKGCPGWPGDEIIEKRRVVIAECVEDIPCNPCEIGCKQGAIKVGTPITNLPVVDGRKCDGCGLCIAICPGLAVFVVEKNYTEKLSAISLPYELLPVPRKGDIVRGLDRGGSYVCDAEVIKVMQSKKFDRTVIVTVTVGKVFVNEVRGIRVI